MALEGWLEGTSRSPRTFFRGLEALTSVSIDLRARALIPRTRNVPFMRQVVRNPGVSG